jgi:anti-sigma factor RsiW
MPNNCRNDEEMINLFIDGELSPSRLRDFEKMLKSDPELKEKVSRYKRIKESLKAFRRVKFPSARVRQARAIVLERVAALS